jgi:hypothetical protein
VALVLSAAALVILVLSRFGLQWLGVVGGAAWAVVRTVVPWLLRLAPVSRLLRKVWERVGSTRDSGSPGGSTAGDARGNAMSRAEALEVLGVDDGASEQGILDAYRNLMRKVHPDVPGGSSYLATKLNQAKDVLLN